MVSSIHPDGNLTKICIFADPHYCTKESLAGSDRKPRLSLTKMKAMADTAVREGVSLIVCLGDFINMEGSAEQDYLNAETAADVLKESGIPVVCCMGNHDCEAMTADEFRKATGFQTAPCFLDLPSRRRLVFLDANFDSALQPYRKHKVDWTDANVPPDQLAWLKEVLNGKTAEVFIHQNLEPETEPHHRVRNADEVLAILKENGVPRVWQGHYHYGAERQYEGIAFVTLKAMCVFEDTERFVEL